MEIVLCKYFSPRFRLFLGEESRVEIERLTRSKFAARCGMAIILSIFFTSPAASWTIRQNEEPASSPTCYANKDWPDRRAMQIGIHVQGDQAFLLWTDKKVFDEPAGKVYDQTLVIDGRIIGSFLAETINLVPFGKAYIRVRFNKSVDAIIDSIAKGKSVIFKSSELGVFEFDLNGTFIAVTDLRRCVKSQSKI